MKKLLLLFVAVFLAVTRLSASENLLAKIWTPTVDRPAVGVMGADTVAWRTDSIISLAVRYKSPADKPAAVYENRILYPPSRKYRFSAWVNLSRSETYLTVAFTDGESEQFGSVTVSTDGQGALVPGRWTRIEAEADLMNMPVVKDFCIQLLPQWKGKEAAVGDVAPVILLSDVRLESSKEDGTYLAPSVLNGGLNAWIPYSSGIRYPMKSGGAFPLREAGAHVNDDAVRLLPNKTFSLTVNNHYTSSLRFRAYSETGATIYIAPDPDLHHRGATLTIEPGTRWSDYSCFVDLLSGGCPIMFTADNEVVIDDVHFEPVYDDTNPRPITETLTVTDGGDSGEGTLRYVMENAPDNSLINFAVDKVKLESPIVPGDRNIHIQGSWNKPTEIITPAGAPAFSIVPKYEGGLIEMSNLVFTGNETGATNGGAISFADSRATARMCLSLARVSFAGCKATSSGGAIYLNSPNVKLTLADCDFTDCHAANGASVAVNNGVAVKFQSCKFVDCASTGTIGGALSVNTSNAVKVDVSGSTFAHCVSSATTGGAGGVAVQGGNPVVTVGRTLFTGCEGGRASAVSIYNNTRGSIKGRAWVVNCTAVNNTGTSPVFATGATSGYTAPNAVFVNNVVTSNEGKALVAAIGTPAGTNNLLDNTEVNLPNMVTHLADQPSFLYYTDGRPSTRPDEPYNYRIWSKGALFRAGAESFETAAGEQVVTDEIKYTNNIWGWVSLGHTEDCDLRMSVDDITVDGSAYVVWPNPVTTVLNVTGGDFDRIRIVDLNGVTVYVGNASTIDVSGLSSGAYVVAIEFNGKVTTQKIIKR